MVLFAESQFKYSSKSAVRLVTRGNSERSEQEDTERAEVVTQSIDCVRPRLFANDINVVCV